MPPDLPSGSPFRRSRDSSVIKKYPGFFYILQGWTACALEVHLIRNFSVNSFLRASFKSELRLNRSTQDI